ncbi:HAD family hydrolase [Jiangella alkaliphila]|uniref:Putative hydrolase of the HAD superfamily n=1 Tax=Jiangella alkaliphila TaxID=419479 RepID=A0A1H2HQP8_9ACTN|nr:HAD family hydrolase [Jiangella alkaliphila]SDU34046.1 putative hydrolase of the HAD superfamily [Jiangella alkaliphila]
MPELAAVVFDLDDTLFDHSGSATRGFGTWLSTFHGPPTPELTAAWFELQDRHFGAWRDGRISMTEQRRRRVGGMLELIGRPPLDEPGLDALWRDYFAAYRSGWQRFDDAETALELVAGAGLRTGILTNGPDDMQYDKIAVIGLTGRVGPVLTAEALGSAKPDPGAYAGLCAALGLDPAAILYVGDDYRLDVVGARAAGLRAVHLDRHGTGPAGERDRIASLHDLAAHLV